MKTILHVGKFYPPVPGGMEHVVESLCHVNGGDVVNRALVFNAGPRTVAEVVEGIEVTRIGTIGAAGSVPIAPGFPAALRRARLWLMASLARLILRLADVSEIVPQTES